ncbi:PREDICTED: zinc finger FYVE domain-containing protein 21-like [Acropora digitifera]|uniref:zinc finger FYVE domain-containing protein 21-like n=1 Tax=Acropora digitifera TaxID=70779 RepID=UPI00077A9C86|nr:PREDICTED: zinc finger FYVE domain-containing protein 21-like [Acropora digitifera]
MSSGKQLIRGKSGMRMIAVSENERSPFLLEEPCWTDDDQFPNCVKCNRKFDFTHRRHHCRRCGMIFCGSCCDHKVMLPRLSFVDPVRVCGECSQICKREEEFFEKHLKILCNGAHFVVDESGPLTFLCKLEHHFHRELLFECSVPDRAAFHEPVLLEKIVSAQLVSNEDGLAVSGLILKYKQQGEMLEVKLTVVTSPDAERKQALSWLVAMQKAIKMLFEVGS